MATIRATPRLGEVARARVGHGVVIWDEKEVLLFGVNLACLRLAVGSLCGCPLAPDVGDGGRPERGRAASVAQVPPERSTSFGWLSVGSVGFPFGSLWFPSVSFGPPLLSFDFL
jgi:hypothetical protein